MSRSTIFISCGQFTETERLLGKSISNMAKDLTDYEPFFAQEVQDLNGLDDNILSALHECVGFITVMHPRGTLRPPDAPAQTRASVWIEQEIAIATYIQRVENRRLPIIAFKHKSVCLEGIRSLLQLNPIEFVDESEILLALPRLLGRWKILQASGIELILQSVKSQPADGHVIRNLEVILNNDTAQRIERYNCELCIPAGLLKHWGARYTLEVPNADTSTRKFRMDERQFGEVQPHDKVRVLTLQYCTQCADEAGGRTPGLVAESIISAKAWIAGREYPNQKTIVELAKDAEKRGDN